MSEKCRVTVSWRLNVVSLLRRSGQKGQTRRLPGEATGRCSVDELLPGRARTWGEVRPQWTLCLLPASWALQTLSICTRCLTLCSKRGTALFRAEPGVAVHPRVLPTPPSPASCAPALHPPGPTGVRTSSSPFTGCAPYLHTLPPPSFVILPSFQGVGRIPCPPRSGGP